MNEYKKRASLKNMLLSSPYIIWIAGFIIIPLIFIFYYGLTDSSGAFTLENIKYFNMFVIGVSVSTYTKKYENF